MKQAYAGGDWDMRQQVIQKAYEKAPEVKPVQVKKLETVAEVKKEWEPDYFDKIYIGLRTYVPSWLMLGLVVVGFLTIVIWKFKKEIRIFFLWLLKRKDMNDA